MNKAAIKNFAVWARNKLIADVSYRASLMGVTAEGIADALPQSTDNMQFFDIGMTQPYSITGDEIKQRKSLVEVINRKAKDSDYETAYSSVIEEVAYTWFNRMIAIRFMEVNDYLPSHIRVLSSESGKLEPDLVTTPFDAELFFTTGEQEIILQLKNDNRLDEVFRLLFIKECNALYQLLPRLFENLSDYTELLLNVSFIDQEGVIYHLIHDIPEEDFNVECGGQVEIIGWLYQYYNAELKDETFALLKQNVKVTKERVPSATQLFTPDWIVRYMVENSLGRLWIEGHPNDSLKAGWKYFLEEVEQEKEVQAELEIIRKEYASLNPGDIKIIDPCMGSGHVLVYAFDVLMQIYESAGWTERDAAKSILENNIFGLDIDDRAAQLAYFAVMMKARQYNRRILDGVNDCHVMFIQESNGFDKNILKRLGDLEYIGEKIIDAFVDAKEYGSIIDINLTLDELELIESKLDEVDRMADYGNLFDQMESSILVNELPVFIAQAKNLVQKYNAVITNPPYMGSSNMDKKLSDDLKKRYPDSKSDLSTVFMQRALSMCKPSGYMAMINIPVWMFISSYEKLRNCLIETSTVSSLLQLGRGIFGSDFGTVAFVFSNQKIPNYIGQYRRLYEKQGSVDAPEVKEQLFFEGFGRYLINQEKFTIIPGIPYAFWASDNFRGAYGKCKIEDKYDVTNGLFTCNNNRFLRLWFEPSVEDSIFDCKNRKDSEQSIRKWYPYNKGGDFRRWYGNHDYVVNFAYFGKEVSRYRVDNGQSASFPGQNFYFHESVSWSLVSASKFGVRYYPEGFVFDIAGSSVFAESREELLYALGFMSSEVALNYLHMTNPTINYQAGDIRKLPLIMDENKKAEIANLVEESICLSRTDWDSVETSWDFKRHPLL